LFFRKVSFDNKKKVKKIFKSFKASPKYTIKWSNYFEIYEKLFKKFVNQKLTFVEIGVGNGGSLFMWKNFFGNKARIIGIELNPDAKKLEKFGFEIFIGDQADPLFWKKFYQKVGKIDILLDDGGHKNLQQITTLMQSIKYLNYGGMIVIEDTHTSYMRDKGFKNPSKFSLINFTTLLIETIHRRNPMLKKEINFFSKKIQSLEYYDSITVINISKSKLSKSKNLENNKKLRNLFDDFRYKKEKNISNHKDDNIFLNFIKQKVSKRSYLYRIYENSVIKKYIKLLKE
tara:strand:+ start:917 stop:1777 length:861 start_codon:yes stop_codon:yes gene_type:complete